MTGAMVVQQQRQIVAIRPVNTTSRWLIGGGARSRALGAALDWLLGFLGPAGVLVVWVDPQKATANEILRLLLERRSFVIEAGTIHECGCAISASRREMNPVRKAA
jgi:hypothetical protein